MTKLKDWLGIIIAFSAVVGLSLSAVNYFATAADLRLVELRLDQKIVSDQVEQVQSRLWLLEDRNFGAPVERWKSQDERNEYRLLQEKLRTLQKRQEQMMKK